MANDHDEADDLVERQRGLELLLGPADDVHLHGVIPFLAGLELGGTPDVLTFSSYTDLGKLYVTCELVGTEEQLPNELGQYELAVCQKEPETWGLDLILKLSYYTLESPINHGETMDIGAAVPEGSNISAFLSRCLGMYTAFARKANVICCVGITERELEYCFEHGPSSLLKRMPQDYILTETKRDDFV